MDPFRDLQRRAKQDRYDDARRDQSRRAPHTRECDGCGVVHWLEDLDFVDLDEIGDPQWLCAECRPPKVSCEACGATVGYGWPLLEPELRLCMDCGHERQDARHAEIGGEG